MPQIKTLDELRKTWQEKRPTFHVDFLPYGDTALASNTKGYGTVERAFTTLLDARVLYDAIVLSEQAEWVKLFEMRHAKDGSKYRAYLDEYSDGI